jgi:hypothetical protein
MNTNETCNWVGISGKSYTYYVHSLPSNFNVNQDGNYIFTKTENNKWVPIYIGQGDLGDRITTNHHKANCILKKGATHVHAHLNARLQDRLAEEQDLLAAYSQAYEPIGCNEKVGG